MLRFAQIALVSIALGSSVQAASLADLLGLDEALTAVTPDISSVVGPSLSSIYGPDGLISTASGTPSSVSPGPTAARGCGAPSYTPPVVTPPSTSYVPATYVTVNINIEIDIDITFNGVFDQPTASPCCCR